jgi:hypothetical protein
MKFNIADDLRDTIDKIYEANSDIDEHEAEIQARDLILHEYSDAIKRLNETVYVLRKALAEYDCLYTCGNVADISGIHCPLDNPCMKCRLERAEHKLSKYENRQ